MATFIIKRHGSNAANQHMTMAKVLGTVEAADSDEAKQKAGEKWTCYNNQHFEAIDLTGRTRKAGGLTTKGDETVKTYYKITCTREDELTGAGYDYEMLFGHLPRYFWTRGEALARLDELNNWPEPDDLCGTYNAEERKIYDDGRFDDEADDYARKQLGEEAIVALLDQGLLALPTVSKQEVE